MLLVDMRLLLFSVLAVRVIQSNILQTEQQQQQQQQQQHQQHCVQFSIIHQFFRIKFVMFSFKSKTIKNCIIRCMMTKNCKSINFHFETTECEISEHTSNIDNMERKNGWTHMENNKIDMCATSKPCPNHDYCVPSCQSPRYECKCHDARYGRVCDTSPCMNGGVCENVCSSPGYRCNCIHPYYGLNCAYDYRARTVMNE